MARKRRNRKFNPFSDILVSKPKSNMFDLSHDRKMSLDMGTLTPILTQEVIPGDTFQINTHSLLRMAPLISPVMHHVDVYTHFFFVPNRLVWDGWEDFITNTKDDLGQLPAVPFISDMNDVQPGSLFDYMGLPVSNQPFHHAVSAIPFAGYNLIYNEYYRDQNLEDELEGCHLNDGENNPRHYNLLRRAWEHDYFTSCLPFAQKGDDVMLPLQGEAELKFDNRKSKSDPYYIEGTLDQPSTPTTDIGLTNEGSRASLTTQPGGKSLNVDVSATHFVDLNSASATTIRDLRRAFKLQQWLEKNARGGTRYIELIKSHFGVVSSDARLQRPEYLGGSKNPMVISEVLQTSESVETPQGNMSGHGISAGSGNTIHFTSEEHGFIIGIMSILPKTAYQQGIPRHYLRREPTDYYWSDFAHIGDQEVFNCELYADATDPMGTFGYIPRYSEYRYTPSSVAGDFKDTLNYWHMGRIFENEPRLNKEFIQANPTKRIFAVQDLPAIELEQNGIRNWNCIYSHVYFSIKAIRPIPKYGNPMM